MRPLILTPLLAACSALGGGATPMNGGDGFFDAPFPSDLRRDATGIDLTGFPGVEDYPLLQAYVDQASALDGFGTTSPIYLRFERDLNQDSLPDPAQSLDPATASLFLVDVDPTSPARGERIPVTWDWTQEETAWQPERLLATQPVWGAPMRPHTLYALVLRTPNFKSPDGWTEVWQPDHPLHAHYEALEETLFQLHIDREEIAFATVFTTQDPLREMALVADATRDRLEHDSLGQVLVQEFHGRKFDAYGGHMRIPAWQRGETPFQFEGGGFEFDEAGDPILQGWEQVEFTFTVPTDEEMPVGGWPVVVYGHGTGGDRHTFANSQDNLEPAAILAKAGLAGFGISLPFHGDRNTGGDPALLSFNYFNPEAGRTNFRAAGLDQLWLTSTLSAAAQHFTSEDGDLDATTDPTRVAYIGHSHGGETGALVVPFFDDTVRSVVLSGAGGGLSITMASRDAGDFDIQSLLRQLFQLDEDEFLDETHPLVGLVQLLSEATDPVNYGPCWHERDCGFGTRPQSVLMFEGTEDIYTPPRAIEALAGSSGQPILSPVAEEWTIQELNGLTDEPTPAQANSTGFDGEAVSAGLAQYQGWGHFPIFNTDEASSLYQHFLASGMDGIPEILEHDPPPPPDQDTQ